MKRCVGQNYVGRNLYWIGLWGIHGVFALRARLRKTLTEFMENLILGIISVALCVYLIRRDAAAGKILTHCHELPSMVGTRALRRRARPHHQADGLYLIRVLDANGRTWLDPVLAAGAAHLPR